MGNLDNINVFKDTEKLCKTNEKLRESIKDSVNKQELILENDAIEKIDNKKYDSTAKIVISQKRTYEAASSYKGKKVAVLKSLLYMQDKMTQETMMHLKVRFLD